MKLCTFRAFVAEQVGRCEALNPLPNYMLSEPAMKEICDWLEAHAEEPWDRTKQSDLAWIQESMGARKVKAVIDDIMEGETVPTIVKVRETWNRLHPKRAAVNRDCQTCNGTGFEIVVGPNGTEGARRCPRGCAVPKAVHQEAIR